MRFGVPFSENDTVFFGGGLEQTQIKSGTNIPAAYLAYAREFGDTSWSLPLTIGWSRDNRDSALAPNSGRYQRLNTEWAVAGDARYIRGNYQYQQYIPLNKQYTFAFNGELGLGKGMNGQPFPVFKNFYSGGLGSVRGFDQGTLGPRDVTGASLGGPKKITLNAELIDTQVEQLMNLAEKFDVEYDGWGTYFEDPNGEEGEDGDDDDLVDEDDVGVRH